MFMEGQHWIHVCGGWVQMNPIIVAMQPMNIGTPRNGFHSYIGVARLAKRFLPRFDITDIISPDLRRVHGFHVDMVSLQSIIAWAPERNGSPMIQMVDDDDCHALHPESISNDEYDGRVSELTPPSFC